MEPRLPNKLYQCLGIALVDFRACIAKPDEFIVGEGFWHDYRSGIRLVGFAGCVMARMLKCDPTKEVYPADFSKHNSDMLEAISELGHGRINTAVWHINGDADKEDYVTESDLKVSYGYDSLTVASYSENRDRFLADMCLVIEYLVKKDI